MSGDRYFRHGIRISTILSCLFKYFMYSTIIILVFAIWNTIKNGIDAMSFCVLLQEIIVSGKIFLLQSADEMKSYIYWIEVIVCQLFNVVYSAVIVKAFFDNPAKIEFSKFFCINSDTNELIFRYIYRTDPKNFLYKPVAKIQILTYADIKLGSTKMKPLYQTEIPLGTMVRGVNHIPLSLDERKLRKALKKLSENCEDEQSIALRLMIIGQDSSGEIMSNIKNYYLRDAFNGYSFLSIQIREYDPVDAEKENFDFVNENHINKVRKCVNEPEFEFKHMDRVPQKKEKMKAIMTEGDIRTNWQEKHLRRVWKARNKIALRMKQIKNILRL